MNNVEEFDTDIIEYDIAKSPDTVKFHIKRLQQRIEVFEKEIGSVNSMMDIHCQFGGPWTESLQKIYERLKALEGK